MQHNRPLNCIEDVCYSLDRVSPFNVVVAAEIKGKVNPNDIENSLEILRRRHYYLLYYIKNYGDHRDFIIKNDCKIPLSIVHFENMESWDSLLEKEANTSFDVSDAPLARAVFVTNRRKNEFRIIITISHIIADGMSSLHFIKDLIIILDNVIAHNRLPSLKTFEAIFPDINFFPSISTATDPIASNKFSNFNTTKRHNYPVEKRKSGIITLTFDKKQTSKIINRCKVNKVTVNSYLASALLMTFKGYATSNHINLPLLVKSSSGVNLRNQYTITVSDEQLGVWSGFGYVYITLNNNSALWSLAEEYGLALNKYINELRPFTHIRKLSAKYPSLKLKDLCIIHESRIPYMLLTNLGRVDFKSHLNRIQLVDLFFVTPMHRNWKNDLGFGACSLTFHKKLNVCFVYPIPAMKIETAKYLALMYKNIVIGKANA